MKYEAEGERQMMEDTQRRIGERAGHNHKGRPMIRDKLVWRRINWETHGERHMMGDKSKHRKDTRRAGHPKHTGRKIR